jgi:hypothetical protein
MEAEELNQSVLNVLDEARSAFDNADSADADETGCKLRVCVPASIFSNTLTCPTISLICVIVYPVRFTDIDVEEGVAEMFDGFEDNEFEE